jgi:hypothetical protein
MRLLGKDNLPYRASILPFTASIKVATNDHVSHLSSPDHYYSSPPRVLSEGFGLLVPRRFIFLLFITIALALLPFTVASCYSYPADATVANLPKVVEALRNNYGYQVTMKTRIRSDGSALREQCCISTY